MPTLIPPPKVIEAFMSPTTRHTRRIEIYESDGITRWPGDTRARLVDGSVSVDYSRDERRTLELTLDNSDGGLRNEPGEFWYDKVIKVFRGVIVREKLNAPRIAVIHDMSLDNMAFRKFNEALVSRGFGGAVLDESVAGYGDTLAYDVVVSLDAGKAGVLKAVTDAGRAVATFGTATAEYVQLMYGSAAPTIAPSGWETVAPATNVHPVARGWSAWVTTGSVPGNLWAAGAAISSQVMDIARSPVTGSFVMAATHDTTGANTVLSHYKFSQEDYDNEQARNFLMSIFAWLTSTRKAVDTWEVQIGEFVIERITETRTPKTIGITARDYTKRVAQAKYTTATQYSAGQTLEAIVRAIVTPAKITKMILPQTGVVLSQSFFFERGKTRWEAVKEVCQANGYDPFFNAEGYLTITPVADPYLQPPDVTIRGGAGGNLADYEKSTNDSRIFNVVIVSGESSNASTPPVSFSASNTDPNSPTSVPNLGPRHQEYTSALVDTVAKAEALATTYLSISALEEYDINFGLLMMPWLEAGDIASWVSPDAGPDDPTNFLLSSLTIPLSLGPMTANAKRVVKVV